MVHKKSFDLDEGDEEVLAIQKNAKLMGYIADSVRRGREGPTKSLAQIKAEVSLGGQSRNGGS